MILKDIPGFEGRYQIDETGIIYNAKRGTIIKQWIGTTGYFMVNLKINNKQHARRVHRFLAQVFIPNPNEYPQINHKNGIKTDNRLGNLEWCTRSENIQHSYDVLKRCIVEGARNGRSKLVLDLETGIFYDSVKFAAQAKGIDRDFLKYSLREKGGCKSLIYA